MECTHRVEDGIVIVTVSGRLDAATSIEFGGKLMALVESAGQGGGSATLLALELAGLEYVSSAGLRELLRAAKAARARGGSLVCCALRDYVKEVFDMSGFSSIIPVEASLEAGQERLRAISPRA